MSGPWSSAEGDPEDVAPVLEVMRHFAEHHLDDPFVKSIKAQGGTTRPYRPSSAEGHWIARIRRAFPGFTDSERVLLLARWAAHGGEYLARAEQVLMYEPWKDDGEALAMAANDGLVNLDTAFALEYDKAVKADHLAAIQRMENRR